MEIQLVGESLGERFERGVSEYPSLGDEVHLVTESDIRKIYGPLDFGQLAIGTLGSSASIEVRIDLDKLVTRHVAILGSTGSGKSTCVASLVRAIASDSTEDGNVKYPSARVLLLDVHGEYARALGDVAEVYRINAHHGEHELYIPYWALDFEDLCEFLTGGIPFEKAVHFHDKIVELKRASLARPSGQRPGANPDSLTVDTPVPFSLKQLWYDLIDQELLTLEGQNRDEPAQIAPGDAAALIPPTYKPWTRGAKVVLNPSAPGIRRPLEFLRSRLLDTRFNFLLHPGPWEPDLEGLVSQDLDALLENWLGHQKAVTILDLSGVPSSVLVRLIGAVLRISYDALFWSRDKSEGGINRPLLIVMEEAHRYLGGDERAGARAIAQRVVKEGRKYGIGAMIVSQRPSEIDETVLSQCGTIFALRLSNPVDQQRVRGTMPDSLSGLMAMLPALRTGEAMITGEAVRLPMRARLRLPSQAQRPDSEDPNVPDRWHVPRLPEDYGQVTAAWRAQSPRAVKIPIAITREPVAEDPAG